MRYGAIFHSSRLCGHTIEGVPKKRGRIFVVSKEEGDSAGLNAIFVVTILLDVNTVVDMNAVCMRALDDESYAHN